MILDTSAVVAILFGEPEQRRFTDLILRESKCKISVANFVELTMVLERLIGPEGSRQCDAFFRRAEIICEPVSVAQAYTARQAFLDFGKGRHPAGLNFGDCFAYALAKTTGEALLFKGADFSRTDIKPAS